MTMTTVRGAELTVLKGNKAAEKCLQHVHLSQTTEAILHPESGFHHVVPPCRTGAAP